MQQRELASELGYDLWDTVDWGRKWLVDFNAGKTQLVSDLFFMVKDIDIGSDANDGTPIIVERPFIVENNIDNVIASLEQVSDALFN